MIISTCFSVWRRVPAAAALLVLTFARGSAAAVPAERLIVASGGFVDGGTIPDVYAYRGCAPHAENRSPQIAWRGSVAGTKSYTVTLFDPDAPTGHGFWHWVLFNVPPTVHEIPAGGGAPRSPALPRGAILGRSDFGTAGYGGPCPPQGDRPHHYVFTVRALDMRALPGRTQATTGPELLKAVSGHVLAEGKLIGRFGR